MMKTETIKVWQITRYEPYSDYPGFYETYGNHPTFLSEDLARQYVEERNAKYLADVHVAEKLKHERVETLRVEAAKRAEAEYEVLAEAGLRPEGKVFETARRPFFMKPTPDWEGKLGYELEEIVIAYE